MYELIAFCENELPAVIGSSWIVQIKGPNYFSCEMIAYLANCAVSCINYLLTNWMCRILRQQWFFNAFFELLELSDVHDFKKAMVLQWLK